MRVSKPLIPENYISLILLFVVSALLSLVLSPIYTGLMETLGIVTDPEEHDHPAMILQNSSARGGGLFFALVFIGLVVIFIPLSPEILGILIGSFAIALLGFLDDYQNTHSDSLLSFFENPLVRLGFLFVVVSGLYFFNIRISFFTNPLDTMFYLNQFNFNLWGITIQPLY